mgnify:CR=1 FL=1
MIIRVAKVRYSKPKKPKLNKFKAYYKRNDRLSDLGYAGYAAYLASDDWKAIRAKKLDKHPHCRLCATHATQVHHTDYSHEVLLGLENGLLVSLCERCHEAIEFFPGKVKRTLPQANDELIRLAVAAGLQEWVDGLQRTHDDMLRKRKSASRQRSREWKANKYGKK